jgi:hypothetical protein
MPVVAYSPAPSQRPPCAALILLSFRLILATQLVLVLIFFQEPIGSRKLIMDVTHLLFSNMLPPWFILILGPFAKNGLSPLLVTTVYEPRHVDLE